MGSDGFVLIQMDLDHVKRRWGWWGSTGGGLPTPVRWISDAQPSVRSTIHYNLLHWDPQDITIHCNETHETLQFHLKGVLLVVVRNTLREVKIAFSTLIWVGASLKDDPVYWGRPWLVSRDVARWDNPTLSRIIAPSAGHPSTSPTTFTPCPPPIGRLGCSSRGRGCWNYAQ